MNHKADRYEVQPGVIQANNTALAEAAGNSVAVIHGMAKFLECELAKPLLRPEEYITGFEVYENGAINLFVHDPTHKSAIAYIRIRPSTDGQ